MGVKDLWCILTPYAERKPICELRGKTVAIDLAGWVCESLNVVDYFVHPRHHLKNLFFRTCYLIWQEVTPVFVLEGVAPKLKSKIIEKRNEIQFRGVKPKQATSSDESYKSDRGKGRTRFNHVLKQCENLLQAMGFQCMQGPGEAEAYCAFLNLKGLVDGVISQDSDCFAYGALRVYRNFSVSTQGALAAQGGAVDIYDVDNINSKMDFGQQKVIAMALLCGCDYCPDGVGGVGRDSVLKLFSKYKNKDILDRIRSWRLENDYYSALEEKVGDKTICSNCGHIGRTQSHTKNGCGICRTNRGCDESFWKEERLALKAEITLRKKALRDPFFPSEEIIGEFLNQPNEVPKLKFHWHQPNMIKFIKQVGHLLQWTEIYCFQKFFPILTRWQVLNASCLNKSSGVNYVTPKEIIKKRVVKGVPSLELLWNDENEIFNGLIPDSQLKEFLDNNPKGLQDIWSTVEPLENVKMAYPNLVEEFLKSKEKPKKISKTAKLNQFQYRNSLENLNTLTEATNDIVKSQNSHRNRKMKRCDLKPRLQMIDRFFRTGVNNACTGSSIQTVSNSVHKFAIESQPCSTPITKYIPSDMESDADGDVFNMSDIVNGIVSRSDKPFALTSLKGKKLCYEAKIYGIETILGKSTTFKDGSLDDINIRSEKRLLSSSYKNTHKDAKRVSLDDSFDVLVKKGVYPNLKASELGKVNRTSNFIDHFKAKQMNTSITSQNLSVEKNVSYFFNNSVQLETDDIFERLMEGSTAKQSDLNENDFVIVSD